MGGCATKPKVDGVKAPVPAPEPEKKAEEKDVVAVEPEKKVEVLPVEVAVEEVAVVDDGGDKVDDQSVKRQSLSHLFKEKEEGSETIENEKPEAEAGETETQKCKEETETVKCKETEEIHNTEEAIAVEIKKAPQTEKHMEEEEEADQTKVDTQKYEVPTTDQKIPPISDDQEKLIIMPSSSSSDIITPKTETPPGPENRSSEPEEIKLLDEKVEKIEAKPAATDDETKIKEEIIDAGKTTAQMETVKLETETQPPADPPTNKTTADEPPPAPKNDEEKITSS